MRAIQITEFGGPEVLTPREVEDPVADGGRVEITVSAAGVNFADTHKIERSYVNDVELPLIPGTEVVGIAADRRRVAALLPDGGYAERAVAHPALCWQIPDGVSDGAALSLILQGCTAWHLLRTSARLREGESVVVHAAAGGVGTLAVQLARRFGAGKVVAVASTEAKRELATGLGADVAIDSGREDLTDAITEACGGAGADVILEMTGGETFTRSLAALTPFGRLVHYGQAARETPAPIDPTALLGTSRGVLGFWFGHMRSRPEWIGESMRDLISMVDAGELTPVVGGTYDLADARVAHEHLRARKTTGKLVLTTGDPS